MKKLVLNCDVEQAENLVEDIGKVRAWLSGFQAARAQPGLIALDAQVPGVDALRQVQILLKESIAASNRK